MGFNVKSGLWLVALILSQTSAMWAIEQKPEELVARHLDSVGTAAKRAANKTRVVQGTARFKILVGGGSQVEGKGAVVSEERKLNIMMKFATDYKGEQFICDGDKSYVAATTSDHRRTTLGEFVKSQPLVLQEGLLGGTLSTAWALLNLDHHHPHLSAGGVKKVDGKQLLDLRYQPKKGNDMDIHLYFDPETYRHVMTTYSITAATGFGTSVPAPVIKLVSQHHLISREVTRLRARSSARSATLWKNASAISILPTGSRFPPITISISRRNYRTETQPSTNGISLRTRCRRI